WGNSYGDYRMKGRNLSGGSSEFTLADRCVSLERFDVYNQRHCISGGPNYYRGDTPPDTIAMPNDNAFKDREFADAMNFDFRLQATSRFRQPGTNYPYKGPYPYEANIYYVKTNGNDGLDGLSMSNAWSTMPRALKSLRPGDTLYIAGGRYSNDAPVSVQNVKIRGRGFNPVVIDCSLQVITGDDVLLERMHFTGMVRVEKGREIAFNNCVFLGSVECAGVKGLRVTHGVLKAPLRLKDCSKVFLSGNLYAAAPAVQADRIEDVVYSSYNSYPQAAGCWRAGGKSLALEDLQKSHDAQSMVLAPELSENNGVVTVRNVHQFAGRGPLGSGIGLYREWQLRFLQLVGPFVYSASDTTANIEWWTSLPAQVELCWGDTPFCTNRVPISQNSFYSYSLIGLEPGKKYYVKIKPTRISPEADPGRRFRLSEQDWASAEFTTAQKSDAAPRTYYVSTNGNNSLNGLNRETAWRSLQYAADKVLPGDTVLIGAGKYPGTVYFRVSGEKGKPITFKAVPGEKAIIEGMGESLKNGLVLYGKYYYNFDTLYIHGYAGGDGTGALLINGGSNIKVTRCHFGWGWGTGLVAAGCRNMLVKNCVFTHGMGLANFSRCPDLNIENNVFIAALISLLSVGNAADQPSRVANNIFGENTRGKQQQCIVGLSGSTVESNNCFYLRWPETERMIVNYLTMPEYRAIKGTDSFVANPQLPGGQGFRQGWQQIDVSDFPPLLASNPELVRRGIGLQPEAFNDCHFKLTNWVYDVAWADDVLAKKNAAFDLVAAGKDADAIIALTNMAVMPMHGRLKSELLEKAAYCANRLKQYDRAIAIATNIPLTPLSVRCQMKIMADNGRYSEIIGKFSQKAMGLDPLLNWFCPDLEDLLVDAYSYRSIAYAESNDFKSAEADLMHMINQQKNLGYDNGVEIREMAWLKLGDFYRKYLKDDAKALAAYTNVTRRTYKPWYAPQPVPKPVLTGNSPAFRDAVKAASEIYLKQGREDEANNLKISLHKARAEAACALARKPEAIAGLKEWLAAGKSFTPAMEAAEKRIGGFDLSARSNIVAQIAESDVNLNGRALNFIVAASAETNAEDAATALRAIIASAPADKINAILDKADQDLRNKKAREYAEPKVKRIKEIFNSGSDKEKWQKLIDEFKDVDFGAWEDKAMAAEAFWLRGLAYFHVKGPGYGGDPASGVRAESDLRKALELIPGNTSAMEKLAENYVVNLKDEGKALDAYLQYLDRYEVNYGGESMRVALTAAGMLAKKGQKDKALRILKKYDLNRVPSGNYRNKFESTIKDCEK
ncbi:MAG: right-handed parallel beta-helix repeat-containing protein, partial [Kiritimatiellia bacterium]